MRITNKKTFAEHFGRSEGHLLARMEGATGQVFCLARLPEHIEIRD